MARRVLFVFEKVHTSSKVLPFWSEAHPEDEAICFYTPPMGSFEFDFGECVPFYAAPSVRDVALYRPKSGESSIRCGPVYGRDFEKMVRDCDHIVCATDFDSSGCRNFLDLYDHYGVSTPLKDVSWIALTDLVESTVRAETKCDRRLDDPEFMVLANKGRARQYFDYLYTLNAMCVFNRLAVLSGLSIPPRFKTMSKYTLQTLLVLSRLDMKTFTESDVFKVMYGHRIGSKKAFFGSPTSRSEIFECFVQTGCFRKSNAPSSRPEYIFSDAARQFVDWVAPECYEPFLKEKIETWSLSWPHSKPDIESYILHFFESQKRIML